MILWIGYYNESMRLFKNLLISLDLLFIESFYYDSYFLAL